LVLVDNDYICVCVITGYQNHIRIIWPFGFIFIGFVKFGQYLFNFIP